MCRLYFAINDEKGNKIRRFGSNKWEDMTKDFLNAMLDLQSENKYGYKIEIRKRKSKKLYHSYTIQKEVNSDFIDWIIRYEVNIEHKHCRKVRKGDICDNECLMCEVDYYRNRQEQLKEMFFVKGSE